MTKFTRIAAALASSILLLATSQTGSAAVHGFTTWELGGQTNTIQSGDLISLSIVQGTESNVYSDTIRFTVGTGNSMTNNLVLTGSDYYNLPNGTVTNGFYNGNVFDMTWMLTYPVTNYGNFFQGRMGLGGIQYSTGTGSVATVTFQGYNPGPTNTLVPVFIFSVTVGRSGGTWGSGNNTWATRSLDYGNSSYTWVEIQAIPEPSAVVLVGLGLAVCGLALRRHRSSV